MASLAFLDLVAVLAVMGLMAHPVQRALRGLQGPRAAQDHQDLQVTRGAQGPQGFRDPWGFGGHQARLGPLASRSQEPRAQSDLLASRATLETRGLSAHRAILVRQDHLDMQGLRAKREAPEQLGQRCQLQILALM